MKNLQTSAVDDFLRLAANHCGTARAILSVHSRRNAPVRIVAAVGASAQLTREVGDAVEADLAATSDAGATPMSSSLETKTLFGGECGCQRVSFLREVVQHEWLALTLCPVGSLPSRERMRALREWVDPFLSMVWEREVRQSLDCLVTSLLDCFDFGIVLFDKEAFPVLKNRTAQKMLEAGDCIRDAGRSISGGILEESIRLQAAINYGLANSDFVSATLLHRKDHTYLVAVVISLKSDGGERVGGTVPARSRA